MVLSTHFGAINNAESLPITSLDISTFSSKEVCEFWLVIPP